jgi:hypothetical protein
MSDLRERVARAIAATGGGHHHTEADWCDWLVEADAAIAAGVGAGWRPIGDDTPRNCSILLTDGTNSGEGFWHDGSERHPSKGGAGWFSEMDRVNLLTAREWFGVIGWMDLPDASFTPPAPPETGEANK